MKLHKKLLINGQPVAFANDDIALHLFNAGKAVFTITSKVALSGIVQYSLGYNSEQLSPFFTGFIHSSHAVNDSQQRIFCRELTATLNRNINISLHAVTLKQTLSAIANDTGLNFITPTQPYSNTTAPRITTSGNGWHLLDSLGDVYGIDQFIWQQQADGGVYVGSWQHSFWATRPASIGSKWQSVVSNTGGARIPAMPRLRPGAKINNNYLTALRLTGNYSDLTWSKNPWTQ